MKRISVIVPTFERTNELERGLESVLNQDYSDLELVVVDDNPSQEYRESVEEIVQKVSEQANFPVRRLINKNKQGVSSARNLGIEHADGEHIAFLDDDDEWKPEKIKKQVQKIQEERVNAVYTAAEMYNGGVNDIVRKNRNLAVSDLLERDRIGSPSKVMVEKEWLDKVDGFDEDIPSAEDWDLWIRLMDQGCNFGYIDEPLTRYHQSDDSKSSRFDIATEGREKVTEKHSDLLKESVSKVRAKHHINRAKKQYQLGDNKGTRKHLAKTLRNKPLELEAYALAVIYLIRKISGVDLIPVAAKLKSKI